MSERINEKGIDEIEAIRRGMEASLLRVLMNGTDMPCADLLAAIKDGISDGIFRAAMEGAFDCSDAGVSRKAPTP